MSTDQNLGTVSASVRIEKQGLRTDVSEIKSLMKSMADNMETATERAERKMTAAVAAGAARRAAILKEYASQAGRTMTVLGAATIAGLGAATKVAADFDQAMRNVNSIAKLSEKQFRELSSSVKNLTDNPNIRQAPEDLAKGLYDVYSSGFAGQKALDILRVSAIGASAGMTDTATSSRVLMAVLNSGIKGVTSAGQAMDVLFQEVNLGVNTFEQLSGALGDVLPTAKTAGVSLQEVAASLAVMTRQGINVNEATTALNNLLIHLIKPGKEAAELMNKLGIEHGIAALQAKGLTGILQEIMEKTHGNKQAMVQLMPEIRGLKALLALTGDQGKLYGEMLQEHTDKTKVLNATQKAAAEQMKGAKAQFEKLTQQVKDLGIEIGDHLLPKGLALLKWIKDQITWFRGLSDATKGTVTNLALLSGGLLLAGGAVFKLITWVSELRTALVTLGIVGAGTGGRIAAGLSVGIAAMGKFASSGAGIGLTSLTLLGAAKSVGDGTFPASHFKASPAEIKYRRSQLESDRSDISRLEGIPYKMRTEPQDDALQQARDNEAFRVRQIRGLYAELEKKSQAEKAKKGGTDPGSAGKGVDPGSAGVDKILAGLDKILAGLGEKKGSGGSGTTSAERSMEDAARDAEQKKRDLEQLKDEILAVTPGVSKFDVDRRRSSRRYDENLRNKMPKQLALDLFTKERAQIDAEQRRAFQEAAGAKTAARDEAGRAKFESNIDAGMTHHSSRMDMESARKQQGLDILGRGLQGLVFTYQNLQAEKDEQREKDALKEEADQKEQQSLDRRRDWESQYNLISLSEYKAYLTERLSSLDSYSEEWMTVQGKIFDTNAKMEEGQNTQKKKKWGVLAQNFQSIFANVFEDTLNGGKNFFGKLLQGFTQMLAQMAAQALATGLAKAIFGDGEEKQGKKKKGGGLLSGLLGAIPGVGILGSLFGFDDAHNDRIAGRWGWDAARNFAVGSADYGRQRGASLAGAGGGNVVNNIHVNMGGVQMASDMDVQAVSQEIAWQITQQMPVVRR